MPPNSVTNVSTFLSRIYSSIWNLVCSSIWNCFNVRNRPFHAWCHINSDESFVNYNIGANFIWFLLNQLTSSWKCWPDKKSSTMKLVPVSSNVKQATIFKNISLKVYPILARWLLSPNRCLTSFQSLWLSWCPKSSDWCCDQQPVGLILSIFNTVIISNKNHIIWLKYSGQIPRSNKFCDFVSRNLK